MREEDVVWLGIEGLHDAIEKGTLTATSIVETFLARIERLDGTLHAFSVLWPERARAAAAPRPKCHGNSRAVTNHQCGMN